MRRVIICPECGYIIDCYRAVRRPGEPEAGDFGVCLSCGCVFVFGCRAEMVRPVVESEMEDDLRLIQKAVRMGRDEAHARGELWAGEKPGQRVAKS